MKKRILALLTALFLGATTVCSCGKADDQICDQCGVNGQEVTAAIWQEAKAEAERLQSDAPTDALIDKLVLPYEANVELCQKCAEESYVRLPVSLLTDPALDENVVEVRIKDLEDYSGKKLTTAVEALKERYPFLFEND